MIKKNIKTAAFIMGTTISAFSQAKVNSWLEDIPGEASLELVSLTMGRDRRGNFIPSDKGDEISLTTTLLAGYTSPDYNNFSFGIQHIETWKHIEGGSRDNGPASYQLGNNTFSLTNEAYINYKTSKNGFLRVGRQVIDINFIRAYNVRHKPQSFEAIVLHHTQNSWKITTGHLSRFSSWSSRDLYGNLQTENRFVDIEVASVDEFNRNRITSKSGIQFLEMSYASDNKQITLYDYFGNNLYNTFGLNLDISINKNLQSPLIKTRYIQQRSNGARFDGLVDTKGYQAGIKFHTNNITIEPGFFFVSGNNDNKHRIRSPFQPNLIIEEPLFEVDIGFIGGSKSNYIEFSTSWQKNTLYLLFLNTEYKDSNNILSTHKEANIIYGHDFNKDSYAKIKLAYASQQNSNQHSSNVFDYRLFLGYRF